MASIRLSKWLPLLSLFLISSAASSAQQLTPTRFRNVSQSGVVVPVMINGAGPFDFQLDTGCMSSVIDGSLVKELHLPLISRTIIATASAEAATPVAHIDSMMMADASVNGLNVSVLDRWSDLRLKARGLLGEDFLGQFDIYIDNRHHLIRLETGPGPLADTLAGEHLPLNMYDSAGERLEPNRLVVAGIFDEFGNREAKLQLDSGASFLMLYWQASTSDVLMHPTTFPVTGVLGKSYYAYTQPSHLRLGKRFFSYVTVIVPIETTRNLKVDGSLPTSMFQSIFISHSGRFVILNPSVKRPSVKPEFAELAVSPALP